MLQFTRLIAEAVHIPAYNSQITYIPDNKFICGAYAEETKIRTSIISIIDILYNICFNLDFYRYTHITHSK